jgi:putative ABC transport system permease protein
MYGVQATVVSYRTHEIGLRMALGAPGSNILGWVIRRGLRLMALGLGLVLLGALGASRLLKGLLYEMSALDPLVITVVPLVLVLAAMTACWLPARRAARVNPMTALRSE